VDKSASSITLEIDYTMALIKALLIDAYSDKLISAGYGSEEVKSSLISIANKFTLADFDDNQLNPSALENLAHLLNISPEILYDSYNHFASSNFPDFILSWRKSNKLSQKKAARLLHVSPTHIYKWERGELIPTRGQYIKLSKLL
jgi:DNA-binding transcriptional regulator YiaG